MQIEVLIQLEANVLAAITADTLARLQHRIAVPSGYESIRIDFEFVACDKALDEAFDLGGKSETATCILISSKFAESSEGELRLTAPARQFLESGWQGGRVVGFIGLGHMAQPDASLNGLDAVIDDAPFSAEGFASAIENVSQRMWYKLPPPPFRRGLGDENPEKFTIEQVTTADSFRQCLQLRYNVYSALGYLDDDLLQNDAKVEFDSYDPIAIHYFAYGESDPTKVVASMRLIAPGVHRHRLRRGVARVNYEGWCQQLAIKEPRRVLRRILNRPRLNAMPILGAFNYFKGLPKDYDDVRTPVNSCEVSRVVVDPAYRGNGLLHLLMRTAIEAAQKIRRSYLLLECAPFHEKMYRKFGFEVVQKDDGPYYARPQKLDALAVAMYLPLATASASQDGNPHEVPGRSYRSKFRIMQFGTYELTIESREFDGSVIGRRLSDPCRWSDRYGIAASRSDGGESTALGALIENAFSQRDHRLDQLIGELFARLPDATVHIAAADNKTLSFDRDWNRNFRDASSLSRVLNNWMEQHRETA